MMLKEWEFNKQREKKRLNDIFKKFDDNGDGVLVFEEFEKLLTSLDPKLKKK